VSAILKPDLPLLEINSRAEWRTWLSKHHQQPTGVWVVTRKKASVAPGHDFVSAVDINEECLCFGWIDSRPGKVDDERSALLCTPRKPTGGWSKVNKTRLERLLAERLVAAPGLAVIEAAKRNGSWTKLDEVDALIVPTDLAAELAKHPLALSNFAAFPPSARKGILEWIAQAKRAETRATRIEQTAALAQDNKRANQWPR
jgi:uncharacterized protein YdeI (YjbR/CyaY-like superfamily)